MTRARPPHILILAAGSSSRMRGADKLLEQIDGTPQITRIARAACDTGYPVIVALPTDRPARAAALSGLPLQTVTVQNAAEGMAASIRAGLAALPPQVPLLILLADLPEITTSDLALLLAAHSRAPDRIHRASSSTGQPGHPVIFPARMQADLRALSGDSGARDLLRRHADQTCNHPLPGNRAITDLDTPEDWAAWRAARMDQSR